MTPIQLADLRVLRYDHRDHAKYLPPTESELLSVLTDEALEAERLRRFHQKLAEQRGNGWTDFHPEKYCHRCGNLNIESWWVASGEWNLAVRNEDGSPIDGYPGSEIICPQCFIEAWDRATSLGVSWEIRVDPLTDKRLIPRPPSRIPYAETDDLIGELVKRGVLRLEQAPVWINAWNVKEGEWISRFVSNWSEPVGSVGGGFYHQGRRCCRVSRRVGGGS